MTLEPKIFNYGESTFNVPEFQVFTHSDRVDVTYFAKVRSKNAFLQRLLKLPHMHNASANWIRERTSQGEGNMEKIITDDSVYVVVDHPDVVIGKFLVDGTWVPFKPQLSRSSTPDERLVTEEVKNVFQLSSDHQLRVVLQPSSYAVGVHDFEFNEASEQMKKDAVDLAKFLRLNCSQLFAGVFLSQLEKEFPSKRSVVVQFKGKPYK